ncbi:MAG TPA: NADH-quinone oxidoreductase subunit M [Bacteroidales bacterium]|nr:NADH-quinone oxidoreductase subunit M [Bacteroidales bacterium]
MLTGLLILIPLAGSAVVMFSLKENSIKRNALVITVTELLLAVFTVARYSGSTVSGLSFSIPWLKGLNVPFSFGVDGLSLLMVLLTAFLVPVIILASYTCRSRRVNIFFGLILLAESGLIGVFTAMNGLVFYLFWEFTLVPVYFIVALWGSEDRIRITFKFLIYTLTGSLIMLAALIYLYFQTPLPHSFSFASLYHATTTKEAQVWIFAAFMLAFAIKIPLVPFHTWQPDTYTVAPAAGSMILSALMVKMGLYGIFRFIVPVTHRALQVIGLPVIAVIVAGVIYASVIALRQDDLKRFIAWISIAHVSLIAAAILSMQRTAMNGAMFQMVAHGINVTGLFIIADIIEVRFKTRKISELGGIAMLIPSLALLSMILLLATVALPFTSGFVGEFLMLLGMFNYNSWVTAVAALTVIFSAYYMLRMYQAVMLGTPSESMTVNQPPLLRNELVVLGILVAVTLVLGCYPKPVIDLASEAGGLLINTFNTLPN